MANGDEDDGTRPLTNWGKRCGIGASKVAPWDERWHTSADGGTWGHRWKLIRRQTSKQPCLTGAKRWLATLRESGGKLGRNGAGTVAYLGLEARVVANGGTLEPERWPVGASGCILEPERWQTGNSDVTCWSHRGHTGVNGGKNGRTVTRTRWQPGGNGGKLGRSGAISGKITSGQFKN